MAEMELASFTAVGSQWVAVGVTCVGSIHGNLYMHFVMKINNNHLF